MATTTTNFGWTIPQSTDLVKDGATAIAALGNGVDTTMAELKGGTTGQILSKTSGTDMDFTWVTPNPGDITGVTAGTGITGGGTSGDVTVDFDVANYGGGQYAAGKNKIINGDFGVWQRGTTFASGTASQYLADRWYLERGSGTYSASQQTFTAGTAPVAGYEGTYFQRVSISVAGDIGLGQRIEDVRTFANQTVTVSFWAKATNSLSLQYVLMIQRYGTGGSAETIATPGLSGQSIGTSWQRYSFTTTMPSIAGKTIGTGSYLLMRIDPSESWTGDLDIWGVQVEAGSTATPFQTATGTKQGELAACQRYYYREIADTTNSILGAGLAYNSTLAIIATVAPVTMRVNPTAVDYSGLQIASATAANAVTAASISGKSSRQAPTIEFTVASGLTANIPYWVQSTSTSGYLGFSAEL